MNVRSTHMTVWIGTTRRMQWLAVLAAGLVLPSTAPAGAQEPPAAAQVEKPVAAMPLAAPKADAAKKPTPTPKSLPAWRGKVIAHLKPQARVQRRQRHVDRRLQHRSQRQSDVGARADELGQRRARSGGGRDDTAREPRPRPAAGHRRLDALSEGADPFQTLRRRSAPSLCALGITRHTRANQYLAHRR